MNQIIKILLVEDQVNDAELIQHEIRKNGVKFDAIRVDTEEKYIRSLKHFKPDIIPSDFSMPKFNGMQALLLKEETASSVPFILVTGSLNEETAVEIMKAGADDYILKDHLTRLCPAIKASIEKKNLLKEKNDAEKQIHMLANALKSISECVSITDINDVIFYVNDSFLKTYCYSSDEIIGRKVDFLRPDIINREHNEDILQQTLAGGWRGELLNKKRDGTTFPVFMSTSVIKGNNEKPIAIIRVAIDISEQKKVREELIFAKEKAEKSDKLKSEFLAQISHEIRSPLNTALNCSNIIREELGHSISSSVDSYLNGIEISGKRLVRTIDLVINMSEMQIGDYQPVWTSIDLAKEIIEPLSSEYSIAAKFKNLVLTFKNNTGEAMILADKFSVNQIFANLFDNAVKYTEEGKIEVVIDRTGHDKIFVSVEDSGIGISDEFMNDIFEPFMQEERGYTRKYEGNGLGLALTKKYCELNNASIMVASQKGKGSKFVVTFKVVR